MLMPKLRIFDKCKVVPCQSSYIYRISNFGLSMENFVVLKCLYYCK